MDDRRSLQGAKVIEIREQLVAALPPHVWERFSIDVMPRGDGLTRILIRSKLEAGRAGGRAANRS